jgi:adenylate cyclase
MDFAAHGLLDGLEGAQRSERERLLTRLHDDGFSIDELAAAVAENRLALLPLDRVLSGTLTAEDIERATGLPAATMIRLWRLLGLTEPAAGDRVFGDEDVAAARSVRLFLDAGLPEDQIFDITRVLGEGMARLSATIAAAFAETFLSAGDREEEVALRFAALAQSLAPAIGPILESGLQGHLREGVARAMLGPEQLAAGDVAGAQDLAVGFADLVGFTRLGSQIEARELGTVAARLARISGELAQAPVRLVKTIGDAAMFVSPDPEALVGVLLAMLAAFEAEDLPRLRAGVAYGAALQRIGDYYGHSVNLASRVTGAARPGTVLCTQEVRDLAPDAFAWSAAGRYRLKGVARPLALYRARTRE